MMNSAAEYHRQTSYVRDRLGGQPLDWGNRPRLYKTYPCSEPVPLLKVHRELKEPLWALYERTSPKTTERPLDLALLSRILALSCCFTARSCQGGGYFFYRAAPSAGALYPNEIYVAACNVGGLEPGLYHYGIDSWSLGPVRTIDPCLYTDHPGPRSGLAASFFITAIFFRSAWKYRARAFRYVLLDAGHLLENFQLALKGLQVRFSVHYDFDDACINRLLGLDESREASLARIDIDAEKRMIPAERPELKTLGAEMIAASRVADREIDYPEIAQVYEITKMPPLAGTGPFGPEDLGLSVEKGFTLPAPVLGSKEYGYGEALLARRSRRNFIRQTLLREPFLRFLKLLCEAVLQKTAEGYSGGEALGIGLLLYRMEGFSPGLYLLDAPENRIQFVGAGCSAQEMAAAGLDQKWLENAALMVLFLTNLKRIHERTGPRGYRHALLNAGRLGQAVYLGAESLGLGCCGIGAFYDEEVRALIGLNPDSALLYFLAVGHVRRRL